MYTLEINGRYYTPTVVSVGQPTSPVTSRVEGLSGSHFHGVRSHPESEVPHDSAPTSSLRPEDGHIMTHYPHLKQTGKVGELVRALILWPSINTEPQPARRGPCALPAPSALPGEIMCGPTEGTSRLVQRGYKYRARKSGRPRISQDEI